MTEREYFEVVAVEGALFASRLLTNRTDPYPFSRWKRYIWALGDELAYKGLDGIR